MDTLDVEQRNVLLQLGNQKVNSIFLSSLLSDNVPEHLKIYQQPNKHSSRFIIFITLKYSKYDSICFLNKIIFFFILKFKKYFAFRECRESWIISKYVNKKFVHKLEKISSEGKN